MGAGKDASSVGSKHVSVVLATYKRGPLLLDLLHDLAKQTLAPERFEVIVVDDGSEPPARQFLPAAGFGYDLRLLEQANAGAAAARHAGVVQARGDIVVITDDDMRVEPDFLEQHLAAHAAGFSVVLGRIVASPRLAKMPIFERFHARSLDRFAAAYRAGKAALHGVRLCTGNVSLRRADYLAVGGFDTSLGRSEDRELGVRLEKAGARLVFWEGATTTHCSDHEELSVWMRRAFHYGVFDTRIGRKHPEVTTANPWRFLFLVHPVARPLLLGVVVGNARVSALLARAVLRGALWLDSCGGDRLAVRGAGLFYSMEYFRGVRSEMGSRRAVWRSLRLFLKQRRPPKQTPRLLEVGAMMRAKLGKIF